MKQCHSTAASAPEQPPSPRLRFGGHSLSSLVEKAGFEFVCDEENMVAVAEAIENENVELDDEVLAKAGFPKESNKVYFVLADALAVGYPTLLQQIYEFSPRAAEQLLVGILWKPGHAVTALLQSMTPLVIRKWLENLKVARECIVCFEELSTRRGGMNTVRCSECPTSICQQCVVDLCRKSELLQPNGDCELKCPNCRSEWTLNLYQFCDSIEKMGKLECFNEETRQFAHEMAELWNSPFDDSEEYGAGDDAFENDGSEEDADYDVDPRYLEFMRELGMTQVSGDVGSGVFVRGPVGDTKAGTVFMPGDPKPKKVTLTPMRCPQCEKAFWDASERKRAPKCGRCKRVSYCSVRCRAKHSSTHSAQCKGKPKGRTPKRSGIPQKRKRKGKQLKKKPKAKGKRKRK